MLTAVRWPQEENRLGEIAMRQKQTDQPFTNLDLSASLNPMVLPKKLPPLVRAYATTSFYPFSGISRCKVKQVRLETILHDFPLAFQRIR